MNNTLTINELIEQLTRLQEMGMGDRKVVYMDIDSMTHTFDEGVHDVWPDGTIVLG